MSRCLQQKEGYHTWCMAPVHAMEMHYIAANKLAWSAVLQRKLTNDKRIAASQLTWSAKLQAKMQLVATSALK
jgi:hypothetical protein